MKNSLRFCLIVAVVVINTLGAWSSKPVLAAGQASLIASRTALVAGDQFIVRLSVTGATGLYGAQFSLAYDAARLKVVEVRPGSAWPAANTFVVRNVVTPLAVEFAATLYNTGASLSGDLAAVTFEALPTGAPVSTPVGTGASLPFLLADRNGNPISMDAPAPLALTISPKTPPAPKLALTASLPAAAPLARGDRFAVSVSVADASTLFGLQFSLAYNGSLLKVVDQRPGAAWPVGGFFVASNQVTAQGVEFAATLTGQSSGLTGTLATVTFEVLGANGAPSTAIAIGASLPLILADRNGMRLQTAAPAPVSIPLAPPPTATPTPTASPTPLPTQTPAPTQTPTPPVTCSSKTIALRGGWNLVALPVVPAAGLTAEGLLQAINAQGGGATAINRWQAGAWQTHLVGLPFNDFAILAGRAVFINTTSGSTLTLCGLPPAATTALVLNAGWNLVTLPSGVSGLTASSLAGALDLRGGNVSEIVAWSSGSWLSHVPGLPFNDFAIQPGQPCFVRTGQPLTWAP